MPSLLVTNATLPDGMRGDILIEDGVIAAIEAAGVIPQFGREVLDTGGALMTPGLTDAHLHPDKAFGLADDDTAVDVGEAIRRVRAAKPLQSADSIRDRTLRLLNWCLSLGTTRVRVHAEIDPLLGLRSVEGILDARAKLAGRMRVEVVAFPQEGIVREPGTLALMREAMAMGCDVVGAITYQDPDARAHLALAAGLAKEFDAPLDVHADFCVPVERSELMTIIETTRRFGLEGRVTLGHCTTLARMPSPECEAIVQQLADADSRLIVLPRTDLYLDGAIAPLGLLRRAGLPGFIASNNLCNAFTPVGRPSLPAVAAFYALANREASRPQLTELAASLWQASAICGYESRIEVGANADLAIWPVSEPWQLVAEEPEPVSAIVGGVEVYSRAGEATDDAWRRSGETAAAMTGNKQ